MAAGAARKKKQFLKFTRDCVWSKTHACRAFQSLGQGPASLAGLQHSTIENKASSKNIVVPLLYSGIYIKFINDGHHNAKSHE